MLLVIFAITGKYVYDSRWLYRITYRHSVTCPHAPLWCRQYRQTPLGAQAQPSHSIGMVTAVPFRCLLFARHLQRFANIY